MRLSSDLVVGNLQSTEGQIASKPCLPQCNVDGFEMKYSFEGLEEGDSRAEALALPFLRLKGVTPRVDTESAFCGKASTFFHNTFSKVRLPSGKRWMTKSSRFICMAYRSGDAMLRRCDALPSLVRRTKMSA